MGKSWTDDPTSRRGFLSKLSSVGFALFGTGLASVATQRKLEESKKPVTVVLEITPKSPDWRSSFDLAAIDQFRERFFREGKLLSVQVTSQANGKVTIEHAFDSMQSYHEYAASYLTRQNALVRSNDHKFTSRTFVFS